jgi:hypothetical protein
LPCRQQLFSPYGNTVTIFGLAMPFFARLRRATVLVSFDGLSHLHFKTRKKYFKCSPCGAALREILSCGFKTQALRPANREFEGFLLGKL